MSILHSVVLGGLQGISEFFPVSSSGHLIIFPWLLGWDDFGNDESLKRAFDVALHTGTFLALLYHFRLDIYRVLKTRDAVFIFKIAIATVPAVLAGVFLFNDSTIENIWLIALLLICFGLALAFWDFWAAANRNIENFKIKDAVILGLAQAGALWPGVSRSGIVITAARFRGYSRVASVELSFWMALPVLLGAGIYKFWDIGGTSGIPSDMRPAFLVGILVSAVVGFLTLKVFLGIIKKLSFTPFVLERILLGLLAFGFLASSFR